MPCVSDTSVAASQFIPLKTEAINVEVTKSSTKKFRNTRLQVVCAIETVLDGFLPAVEIIPHTQTAVMRWLWQAPLPCTAAPLLKAVLFIPSSNDCSSSSPCPDPMTWTERHPHSSYHTLTLSHL